MITVTVKFVVQDQDEADSLMNEIAEDIGNNAGYPFIASSIEPSTTDEIKTYMELTD